RLRLGELGLAHAAGGGAQVRRAVEETHERGLRAERLPGDALVRRAGEPGLGERGSQLAADGVRALHDDVGASASSGGGEGQAERERGGQRAHETSDQRGESNSVTTAHTRIGCARKAHCSRTWATRAGASGPAWSGSAEATLPSVPAQTRSAVRFGSRRPAA